MKAQDVDINTISNLEYLYNFLDENALLLARDNDISNVFVKYKNKDIPDVDKTKVQ